MSSSAGHVFVSHGSENRDEANALSAFLESRGIRTWIAPRDVRPGMDYSEQLQLAIEECAAFAVMVTEKANKSPYVRAETEMAFSTHKPIFPVRMSDIKPAAGLALFLKIRHWTDAFGAERDENLERLARELRMLTGADGEPDGGPAMAAPAPPPAAAPPPPPAAEPAPPAPPPPTPPPPAPAPAPPPPVDEERLRAAVGTNADYYIARWNEMRAKGSSTSWNWPACLANLYWFAWRKMWAPFGLLLGAFILVGLIGAADPSLGQLTFLISIGFTFVTGTFGNHLYRRHIERLVASTAGMESEAALAMLRQRGGTSNPALLGTIGATVLVGALSVAGQLAELQRKAEEQEMRNRVDAAFNETYRDSGQTGDDPALDEGDKPVVDDYYYPEGE